MDTTINTLVLSTFSYTFNLKQIIERDDGKKEQTLAYRAEESHLYH